MTYAIEAQNIIKKYGHIQALNGLSLQVKQGEIFGLLGANGAGKTTLIKILVGILKADSGDIHVMDMNPVREKHKIRLKVGYMPQSPALYDDLTARENIRFFGRAHRIQNLEQRINEVLEFTLLGDRADDPIYSFSGGMRQRASLACALVHEPDLLLLDEPGAGVDPKLRESFWIHFRELAAQGKTLLVSTHQMDEALHCDRVAVMRAGEVLASDAPRELLRRGKTHLRITRNGETQQHTLSGQQSELLALLQQYGLSPNVTELHIEEDTLEDVVLRIIDERKH